MSANSFISFVSFTRANFIGKCTTVKILADYANICVKFCVYSNHVYFRHFK